MQRFKLVSSWPLKYRIRETFSTLLCLIVSGGSNCKFWGKNPQVHLIIIREWPKNNTPILRNLDNIPPGVFIWPTLQLDTKEYCNYFTTIFSKTAWILSAELQNYLKRLSGLFLYFQRYFNSTWLVPKL